MVDFRPEHRKQLGSALHLVEHYELPAVLFEEQLRLGQLSKVRGTLQIEIKRSGRLFGNLLRQRGFADLPRSEQHRSGRSRQRMAERHFRRAQNDPCIFNTAS